MEKKFDLEDQQVIDETLDIGTGGFENRWGQIISQSA